ncbi:MAG: hypothetical protein V4603_03725 [Pseudomonadota bacterium]
MKALRATLSKYSLADLLAAGKMLLADSAHQDILATIKHSLVLHEDILLNTANGEYRQVAPAEGESREEALARAARQLVTPRDEVQGILLLLPTAEFISTRYHLALTGESMLRSALMLQAHTLIPAYEQELLLGLNGRSQEGVALWYPARAAEALFLAFQAQNLFLAAVTPRTLALASNDQREQDLVLVDEDATHVIQMELRAGALRSHFALAQTDLEQPEFAEQWQAESARVEPAQRIRSTSQEFWTTRREHIAPLENYCFFPKGAEQYGRKLLKQKQKRFAGIAAGVLVVLMFLPFLGNWMQMLYLDAQIASLRDDSADARRAQAAVYAMEDEWGVISEYPRQDVAEVLVKLNELINNSLSTFALEKGAVDITGFAQDPALLMEQLAEQEEFYDISQSRSSSGADGGERGDRFGIRFSLSEVDFAAYEERHPAVEQ